MPSLARQQAARHPFIAGVAILVLGPYILAFVLVFIVFYVIACALDLLAGGHR
jgi:hypothetical protein